METPRRMGERHANAAETAQRLIKSALEDGRTLLTAPEAMSLLAAYGVPTVETFVASTPTEAAMQAEAIAQPVALKILHRTSPTNPMSAACGSICATAKRFAKRPRKC